jgi:hypothetical protein
MANDYHFIKVSNCASQTGARKAAPPRQRLQVIERSGIIMLVQEVPDTEIK